ncbi:MAG: hypothetical protein ACK481_07840 [Candidatus Melainabacteria bacterium]
MPNNSPQNLYIDPNQEEDLRNLSSRTEELLARLDELSSNLNSNLHNRPRPQFDSRVDAQINSQLNSQSYTKPNYDAQSFMDRSINPNNFQSNYQNPEANLPAPIDNSPIKNNQNNGLSFQPIEIPSNQIVKPTYQYSIPINTHYVEKSEKSIQTSTNGGFLSKETSVFTEKRHFGLSDQVASPELNNQVFNNQSQPNNILNSSLAEYLSQKPVRNAAQLSESQNIKQPINQQNISHNKQPEPIKTFPKHDLSFMDSHKSPLGTLENRNKQAYNPYVQASYSQEEENYQTNYQTEQKALLTAQSNTQSNIQQNNHPNRQSQLNWSNNLNNSDDLINPYQDQDIHYQQQAQGHRLASAPYRRANQDYEQYGLNDQHLDGHNLNIHNNIHNARQSNQYQQVVMDYPPARPRYDERKNHKNHYTETNSEISLQPSSAFSFEPGQTRRASAKRGLNTASNNQNTNQNFFGFGKPERAYADNRENLFEPPNQSMGQAPNSNREFRNSMVKYANQNHSHLNKDKEVFRWFAVAAPIFALAIPFATINFFSLSWIASLAICSIALFFGLFISIIAWRLVEISELVRWEHGQIMVIQSILNERTQ